MSSAAAAAQATALPFGGRKPFCALAEEEPREASSGKSRRAQSRQRLGCDSRPRALHPWKGLFAWEQVQPGGLCSVRLGAGVALLPCSFPLLCTPLSPDHACPGAIQSTAGAARLVALQDFLRLPLPTQPLPLSNPAAGRRLVGHDCEVAGAAGGGTWTQRLSRLVEGGPEVAGAAVVELSERTAGLDWAQGQNAFRRVAQRARRSAAACLRSMQS